uniref:transposase zinc-binding domain-containing protein n=1 Tax=Legionella lytica TaxID=96232 RepID=UPI00389947D7
MYSEHGGIRESVDYSINKILSCRHYMRGHAHYHCSNPSCTHEKQVHFSCKDRGYTTTIDKPRPFFCTKSIRWPFEFPITSRIL